MPPPRHYRTIKSEDSTPKRLHSPSSDSESERTQNSSESSSEYSRGETSPPRRVRGVKRRINADRDAPMDSERRQWRLIEPISETLRLSHKKNKNRVWFLRYSLCMLTGLLFQDEARNSSSSPSCALPSSTHRSLRQHKKDFYVRGTDTGRNGDAH